MRPQVFDCFTFFNELELLEVRLEELSPVVDWFVVVEAARTFTNKPKPFFLAENRSRYSKFLHKIVNITLGYMPEPPATAWNLEAFQRDGIALGLDHCDPDDYVMISDVDEIPRADAVASVAASGIDAAALCMPLYYYKFNCKEVSGAAEEPLTVMARRRFLSTPQAARLARHGLPLIPDAGWHFSYLGDADRIRTKIEAFAHEELNRPEYTDKDRLEERISAARDPFDRSERQWRFVPLDETFPQFVRENKTVLSNLIQHV